MGGTTTVKKKINLFIAMILSVTMLFGSTVCFAAENDEIGRASCRERV